MSCQYCEKGADLLEKMLPICSYRNADIYLFRDQTHKGKCIVAYRDHKKEWYELSGSEQADLIAAVAATAKAVQKLFHADKINYATYGDLLSHLHILSLIHILHSEQGAAGVCRERNEAESLCRFEPIGL